MRLFLHGSGCGKRRPALLHIRAIPSFPRPWRRSTRPWISLGSYVSRLRTVRRPNRANAHFSQGNLLRYPEGAKEAEDLLQNSEL